jgi:hypothetical protein
MSTTTRDTNDTPSIAESIAVVQFRGEPERLQSLLLPPPLEPIGKGETAFAVIGDAIRSGCGQEHRRIPIKATGFLEAAVGMPCRYEGERYVINPLLFLDRQTESFKNGLTRGIGSITKTKWHAACEGRREITPGDSVAGSASHSNDTIFSLSMELKEQSTKAALDDWVFDFVHYRHLSDPLADEAATSLINDITLMELPSVSIESLWSGSASLTFGDWKGGLLKDLVGEVKRGYHVTMGYQYAGERVLTGVDDWGGHIE